MSRKNIWSLIDYTLVIYIFTLSYLNSLTKEYSTSNSVKYITLTIYTTNWLFNLLMNHHIVAVRKTFNVIFWKTMRNLVLPCCHHLAVIAVLYPFLLINERVKRGPSSQSKCTPTNQFSGQLTTALPDCPWVQNRKLCGAIYVLDVHRKSIKMREKLTWISKHIWTPTHTHHTHV